ncbi:hypothetical protein CMI37_14045 [Candidatus Pacearchaeota archaeon]|nr:hypothetical protein [Candidatus Pacearchaeota archaeon]|tara:strand:- start:1537 stop:1938 length:402 start_codon:yes stop_codon:yes gene_type:complete
MDLAQFDLQEAAGQGITVTLVHPITQETLVDDDGKKVTIKVLGKDSAKWSATAKKYDAKNANKYRNKKVPTAALENSLMNILAECTISWTNVIYDEKVLKCDSKNALMLYQNRGWVAEQVIEAAAERANYNLK